MTPNELKDFINGLFKDRLTAADPRIDPGLLRTGFGQVLDFMYGTFAALKETVVAKVLTAGRVNDLILNKPFQVVPGPGNSVYYLKIAQLLVSSSGLRDVLSLEIVAGLFGGGRGRITAVLSNRDGFNYTHEIIGDTVGCALVGYRQGDGTVVLYLRVPNDFRAGSYTVKHCTQVVLFPDLPVEDPAGTLCFDSLNMNAYPPALLIGQNSTAIRGYLSTGLGNTGFQVTSVKSGSNLSLNTGQYLELKLDTGVTLKVALLN